MKTRNHKAWIVAMELVQAPELDLLPVPQPQSDPVKSGESKGNSQSARVNTNPLS